MTDVAEANEVRIPPGSAEKKSTKPDIDAMVAAATKRVLAELAAAPRPEPKNCGNCRSWSKLHMSKTHGQCMLSGKNTAIPAITTDLARCSGWQDL